MKHASSVITRFYNWLASWIRNVFRRRPVVAQLLLLPPPLKAPRRVRAPSERSPSPHPRNYTKRDLGELLDGIEETFTALTRGTYGHSNTAHETRVGLKRMGPVVIPKSWFPSINFTPITDPVIENAENKWPALIFAAINEGGLGGEASKFMYPDFLYAVKLGRRPFYLKDIGDVIYETGAAYRTSRNHLYWISFHVGINKQTGIVTCARELMNMQIPVNNRERDHYNLRAWMVPVADRDYGPERYQLIRLATIFSLTFGFWERKAQLWQISVRHSNRRCTFAVHPKQTSVYFRDRKRTALTAAGKLRPIIHHVREHVRILPTGRETTVKEHIHGLRLFDWRGYACAVTAPKFHKWVTDDFELPSEDMEHITKDHTITLPQLGSALAAAEDEQSPEALTDIL